MSGLTLLIGLLLPWLLGVAALGAIRTRSTTPDAAGEIAWLAGAGYFVGAFVLTLWMRVLSLTGVPFGVLAIGAPIALATVALGYLAWRRDGAALATSVAGALRALVASPGLTGASRVLWLCLGGWLALRFALLALAVNWQPLYPWDAWIQWATKARVWYELGQLVPFALPDAWFAANGAVYFDAAPQYPPTMPLLQVWADLALGQWDDARMNWPWWQIAVALAFAVYGGLSRLGVAALPALVGAFLVATLPLANTHVALAGYADFPLAAFYTVAVLALLRWGAGREIRDALLAVLLAVACTQIKNPGLFWALTLVPGALVLALPRRGLAIAAAAMGGAVMLLAVLARAQVTVFNYRLNLEFDPAWAALVEAYFLQGNWNLLWYAAIGVAVLEGRRLFAPPQAPLTMIVIAGVLFLFAAFGFTNAGAWISDQTTVNRATLHFAPVIAVFVVVGFLAFSRRWMAAHPVADEVPGPAGEIAP